MRNSKPGWYRDTVNLLKSYPGFSRRVEILDKSILSIVGPSKKITQSFGGGGSGIDPEVEHDELSRKMEIMEVAVEKLDERKKYIVKGKYFIGERFLDICEDLGIGSSTYYREHDEAIRELASMLGFYSGKGLAAKVMEN